MDSSTGIILVIILLIVAYVVYIKTIKGLDEEYPEQEKKSPKEEIRKWGLKTSERRFLIVWICICLFALISNIAPIRGIIDSGASGSYSSTYFRPTSMLFSSGDAEEASKKFWPFTNSFQNKYAYITDYSKELYLLGPSNLPDPGFFGIFNGFDYLEFIVYTLLGLAIVFIPKIW